MERKISRFENKGQIRRHYKKQRDAMPVSLARQLSEKISAAILQWELYQRANAVFFYYPLGKEVSLLPVIEEALQKGRRAAFPKTVGDIMEFYEVTDLQELEEGNFHVMEPKAEGRRPVCWEPELCFVPGVAFGRAGERYGYGRGYYDRYFADRGTVRLVGCAYGSQIAEKLPVGAWDVRVDDLVSEEGIFSCRHSNVRVGKRHSCKSKSECCTGNS